MDNQFVILAHVPTDSVTSGFIPAIRKRGIPLLVVTDQPERHQALVDRGILQPDEVLTSDVFNPIAVLNTLSQYRVHPEAVFTNSDHLQSSSAIVAQFYSLPSKNWRACYRAKNKLVMRQAIAKAGLDSLWFDCLTNPAQLSTLNIPYPCITKQVEGVASENVAPPSLSFRTLAPGYDVEQPYIKLPVAAQMTSSMRNLSSSSVENAPRIAIVLQEILNLRPDIAKVLRLQLDEVGVHCTVDNKERDDDRYLSVLFRRNPGRLLSENEHAVVIAALFVTSPVSREPLIVELMRLSGVSSNKQAREWFKQYSDTLFTAVLTLFLEYGIALEAHQQNMMAVFDGQGNLHGFINRDVGGICIHQTTLADRGWPIQFTAAATLVEQWDDVRLNFSHTVLQSHIAELIQLLDGFFGLSAPQLWQDISLLFDDHLLKYAKNFGESAYNQEYQAFFKTSWPGTAFIRMRLQNQSLHAAWEPITNPLIDTAALKDG